MTQPLKSPTHPNPSNEYVSPTHTETRSERNQLYQSRAVLPSLPLLDLPFVSGHWLLIAPVFIIRQTHLTIRVIRGRSSLLWAYAIQVAPSALVAIRDIPISVTHNLLPLLDLCGAGHSRSKCRMLYLVQWITFIVCCSVGMALNTLHFPIITVQTMMPMVQP